MVGGGEANQALADSMIEQIETSDIEVVDLADRDALVSDIENDQLDAGFVLPEGFEASVAAGEQVEVGYVARPEGAGPHMRAVVDDALASVLIEPTAVRAAVSRGAGHPSESEAEADLKSTSLNPRHK